MPETVESFAAKVRKKYPQYKDVDDNKLTFEILNKYPVYRERFTARASGGNVFSELFKQGLLGFSETFGKTYEGAVDIAADVIANPTISEEEFNRSPRSRSSSYKEYAERNEERLEKQKSAYKHAERVSKYFDETLPEQLNADPNFGESGFGAFAASVARGLGQFAGYAAAGGAVGTATTAATTNPIAGAIAGTGAVFGTAFFNRTSEFVDDAENTLGKKVYEMSDDEAKKVTDGSIVYGAVTGALDATVFKYVAGMKGPVQTLFTRLKFGKEVAEKDLKKALLAASRNAIKSGIAEGSQESLGDGAVLDLLAKNLYDSDRNVITGDALARRTMEFAVGFTVGGLASGAGDTARIARGERDLDPKIVNEGAEGTKKFNVKFTSFSTGKIDTAPIIAANKEEAEKIFKKEFEGQFLPEAEVIVDEIIVEPEVAPEQEPEVAPVTTPEPTTEPTTEPTLETETEQGETNLKPKPFKSGQETGGFPIQTVLVNGETKYITSFTIEGLGRKYYFTDEGGIDQLDIDGNDISDVPSFEQPLFDTRKDLLSALQKKVDETATERTPEPEPTPTPEPTPEPEPDATTNLKPVQVARGKKSKSTKLPLSASESPVFKVRALGKDMFFTRDFRGSFRLSDSSGNVLSNDQLDELMFGFTQGVDEDGASIFPSSAASKAEMLENIAELAGQGPSTEISSDIALDAIPEQTAESGIINSTIIKYILRKYGVQFGLEQTGANQEYVVQNKKLMLKGKFVFMNKAERAQGGKNLKIVFKIRAPKGSNSAGYYSPRDHTIVLHLDAFSGTGEINTNAIDRLMRHELIHAVTSIVAKGADGPIYKRLNKLLTTEQKKRLDKAYGGETFKFGSGAEHLRGAEYIRAIVEQFSYGGTSEEFKDDGSRKVLTSGPAFTLVKKFIKDVQAYVARIFNKEALVDSSVANMFLDSADLLQQVDPEARPVNQKLIDQVRSMYSENTEGISLSVNDMTRNLKPLADGSSALEEDTKSIDKVDIEGPEKGVGVFSKFLVPVGQLLADIHPSLETVFTNFIKRKDYLIFTRGRMIQRFSIAFNAIEKRNKKDYKRLWSLISFSPNTEDSRFSEEEQKALGEERTKLLIKYNMLNQYTSVRFMLDEMYTEASTRLEIGNRQNYFPRYLDKDGRVKFLRKYGFEVRTIDDALKKENDDRKDHKKKVYEVIARDAEGNPRLIATLPTKAKADEVLARVQREEGFTYGVEDRMAPDPIPPILTNSLEEELFIQKLLMGGTLKPKRGKGPMESRAIELIDESDIDFYVSPTEALAKYIIDMTNSIETAKFMGARAVQPQEVNGRIAFDFDPTSELALVVQQLKNDPSMQSEVNQEKLFDTLPQITKALMANTAQEMTALRWMRQFSYFSLLTEFTSTMSQLYDMPFIAYDNGFFNTLGSAFRNKEFDIRELLDTDRVFEENFQNDKNAFKKIIDAGLTLTGFRTLDRIMKNTTMDANYRRYKRLSNAFNFDGTLKKQFQNSKQHKRMESEINTFLSPSIVSPNARSEFFTALKTDPKARTKRQHAAIADVLVSKLLVNQPLSQLRMPLAATEDPNTRMLYTMKSFMIVQFNTSRNIALNDMFGAGRTKKQRAEGLARLTKLLAYFLMLGVPIDLLKDLLAGRLGYWSDYMFNSTVRLAGINKYFLYKGQYEGYGDAAFDFVAPAPLTTVVDSTNAFFDLFEAEGSLMERSLKSKFQRTLPLYDTLQYVSPEARDYKKQRERRFMKKRMRQEGSLLFFEDPFQKINPRPIGITREALGI